MPSDEEIHASQNLASSDGIAPDGVGMGSTSFNVEESCDKIKEEFNIVNTAYQKLYQDHAKLLAQFTEEKAEMHRSIMMFHENIAARTQVIQQLSEMSRQYKDIIHCTMPYLPMEIQAQMVGSIRLAEAFMRQNMFIANQDAFLPTLPSQQGWTPTLNSQGQLLPHSIFQVPSSMPAQFVQFVPPPFSQAVPLQTPSMLGMSQTVHPYLTQGMFLQLPQAVPPHSPQDAPDHLSQAVPTETLQNSPQAVHELSTPMPASVSGNKSSGNKRTAKRNASEGSCGEVSTKSSRKKNRTTKEEQATVKKRLQNDSKGTNVDDIDQVRESIVSGCYTSVQVMQLEGTYRSNQNLNDHDEDEGKIVEEGSGLVKPIVSQDICFNNEELTCAISSVKAGGANTKILTGGKGVLKLWDVERVSHPELQFQCMNGKCIRGMNVLDETSVALVGELSIIQIWDLSKSSKGPKLEVNLGDVEDDSHYSVARAPKEDLIYITGNMGSILAFDPKSGKIAKKIKGHQHISTCITISSDGSRIWSGSMDSTVRSWDLRADRLLWEEVFHSEVYCIGHTRQDDFVVVGTQKGPIASINDLSLKRQHFGDHTSNILSLDFAVASDRLCSTTKCGVVDLWMDHSGGNLFQDTKKHPILCSHFAEDDTLLLTGSGDGVFAYRVEQ